MESSTGDARHPQRREDRWMIIRRKQIWAVGNVSNEHYIGRRTFRGVSPGRIKVAALLGDIFICLVALACVLYLPLAGQLPLGEVILFPIVPLLALTQARKLGYGKLPKILLLAGLWLASQIITDIYRSTPFDDWSRGDARIIFFFVNLIGLTFLLQGNQRRQILFVLCYAIGQIFRAGFFPDEDMTADIWKFGYALSVTWIIVLYSCYFYYKKQFAITSAMFAVLAIIHLVLGSRAYALMVLLVAVLALPIVPERIGRSKIKMFEEGTLARLLFLLFLACVAGIFLATLYSWAASSGRLGEKAFLKYQSQSRGKLGLLIGGRTEILVSTIAIKDSPLIGHGSWAKDPKYSEILNDLRFEYGYTENESDDNSESDLIPTHSHLFGAWVDAGILGAVFWIYIIWLLLQGILRATELARPLTILYAYGAVSVLWDIFFSPFGTPRRMTTAFILVLAVDILGQESVKQISPKRHSFSRFHLRRKMGVVQ
jgi:hypothetical protein